MKKLAKGFTLIELMIVVAIIGILAAIAIPNFVKYQLRSKFSEGATNVEGLRKAEEALQQGERALNGVATTAYAPGQYWNLGGAVMPATGAAPGTSKNAWTAAELAQANTADWSMEGATYFSYQIAAAGAVCPGVPAVTEAGMCYSITAQSNLDGNATPGWVVLVRPATSNPALMEAVLPATAVFPGTVAGGSTCLDRSGQTTYSTPCVSTGPDTF